MKVVLELQDQPSNIKRVTIRHDVVLGRGADCNLRLSAPQVSRRHCFLRVNGDGATISDLESSNGTYLDGMRLAVGKNYKLEDGAQLAVGPVKFIARVRPEASVAEALTPASDASPPEPEIDDPFEDAEDKSDQMSLAIEQGGESTAEDEATADYSAGDELDGGYFSDVGDDEDATLFQSRPAASDDDPRTVTVSGDEVVGLSDDDDIFNVAGASDSDDAEIVISGDNIEIVDDDMDDIFADEDVEVEAIDEDVDVLVMGDDEIDIVDEEEGTPQPAPASADDASAAKDDPEAQELRDFLQGLQ